MPGARAGGGASDTQITKTDSEGHSKTGLLLVQLLITEASRSLDERSRETRTHSGEVTYTVR